jgi:hypothetical protein
MAYDNKERPECKQMEEVRANNHAFSIPPAVEDGLIILEIVLAKPDLLGVGRADPGSFSSGIIRIVSSVMSCPSGTGRGGRAAIIVSRLDGSFRVNIAESPPLIVPVDSTSSVPLRLGLALPLLFRNVPVEGGDEGRRGDDPVAELYLTRLLVEEEGDVDRPLDHFAAASCQPCDSTELEV